MSKTIGKISKSEASMPKPLENEAKVDGPFQKALEKTVKIGVSLSKTVEKQRKNVERAASGEPSGDICVETSFKTFLKC